MLHSEPAQVSARTILTEPQLSTRVVAPLLEELDRHLPPGRADQLVEQVGLDPAFVRDPEHWVSVRFVQRLRDLALPELAPGVDQPGFDHPVWQLWRRAGHASLRRQYLGPVFVIVRALGSPRRAYEGMAKNAHMVTRAQRYEVIDHSPGRLTLRIHPLVDLTEDGPEACWTQIGMLEATPGIWDLPMARVRHLRCRHRGDATCDFEVRFRAQPRSPLLVLAGLLLLGAVVGAVLGALAGVPLAGAAAGMLAGLATEGWRRALQSTEANRRDIADLQSMVFAADRRAARLWADGEQLRRLILAQRNVQAFLPPPVFDRLARQAEPPRLGGARIDTTVLFSDVQGYSAIAEHLSPDHVVELLNAYFDEMAAVVEDHGGTVLEFMGDGLLVVFGAPEHQPDHAVRAIACAAAMHRRVAEVNAEGLDGRFGAVLVHAGFEHLRIRIGLHSGEVLAGNLGGRYQMRYSVIGDVVNVAAHLERLNKLTLTRTLLSGDTRARLANGQAGQLRSLGPRRVKGRAQPVELWTPDPEPEP